MGHNSPKHEPQGIAESVPKGAAKEQEAPRINALAKSAILRLRQCELTITTAESCTGGGIGEALTRIPGASDVYLGGVIAYANDVKSACLGVDPVLISREGAVSRAVAEAMAQGARRLGSDVAVATTGIAGPSGGTPDKPVGLVWIAWSIRQDLYATSFHFDGDREAVRRQAIEHALQGILERLVE